MALSVRTVDLTLFVQLMKTKKAVVYVWLKTVEFANVLKTHCKPNNRKVMYTQSWQKAQEKFVKTPNEMAEEVEEARVKPLMCW